MKVMFSKASVILSEGGIEYSPEEGGVRIWKVGIGSAMVGYRWGLGGWV